jgi:hypothetical protein
LKKKKKDVTMFIEGLPSPAMEAGIFLVLPAPIVDVGVRPQLQEADRHNTQRKR